MRKIEIIKLIVALMIGAFLGFFFIGAWIKQWRFNENNIVFCFMRDSWFYVRAYRKKRALEGSLFDIRVSCEAYCSSLGLE